MQNVYKCVYDYDDQQIDRLTKNGSSILGLFKVIVENERFVLMPVNHLNAKDRSVYFNEIEKVKMTYPQVQQHESLLIVRQFIKLI